MIATRMAEVDVRYQALFDDADVELERAVRADPELGRTLRGFEFDIDSFCASPEAAEQMRAQLDAGSITDMDYAVRVPKP